MIHQSITVPEVNIAVLYTMAHVTINWITPNTDFPVPKISSLCSTLVNFLPVIHTDVSRTLSSLVMAARTGVRYFNGSLSCYTHLCVDKFPIVC